MPASEPTGRQGLSQASYAHQGEFPEVIATNDVDEMAWGRRWWVHVVLRKRIRPVSKHLQSRAASRAPFAACN